MAVPGGVLRGYLEDGGQSPCPTAAEHPVQPAILRALVDCGSAQGYSVGDEVGAMSNVYSNVCRQSIRWASEFPRKYLISR